MVEIQAFLGRLRFQPVSRISPGFKWVSQACQNTLTQNVLPELRNAQAGLFLSRARLWSLHRKYGPRSLNLGLTSGLLRGRLPPVAPSGLARSSRAGSAPRGSRRISFRLLATFSSSLRPLLFSRRLLALHGSAGFNLSHYTWNCMDFVTHHVYAEDMDLI